MGTAIQVPEFKLIGTGGLAPKYLSLYLEPLPKQEWEDSITTVWKRQLRFVTPEQATEKCKRIVTGAILMPELAKVRIPDPPRELLFTCDRYRQFNDRDWYVEFQKVVIQDDRIAQWRKQAEELGIIEKIEFVPTTRQAYHWLLDASREAGDWNEQISKSSFLRLVWAYGGTPIIETFTRRRETIKKRVLNWRTGYFFERLMFDTFKPEQVLKMKRDDLRTNQHRVKSVMRGE